ncbi:MAG TPA: tRNA (5-methylaminomethyl-2-thiouridine)(34)-methyltransferase MnmD [Flavobacteriaceae bacterium]|nr:tRNA (5-methylaminomethyl-2-thiouridine)(34)-methyltransferase MnmD [Flavobacteriaceae bacterium]MCB9213660.1 tRNA (5-methylaminomethyl-2-thiouridine)(34)-methyltransferase MnmD [Alteromonas sp.]HPF12161.1 tRNA (5-methylaminomethyl-2-thiouridine)(34)-methyltransferase MnmD [Flavobacteriaceae bacterium]HQU22294.1 tRNA (5-methylaminomethyl-2-thiouridine)(34)-methyltransferase MnmD [Flavobacteriaceae bacterium]HQU65990.1 tRNA (5-methylaminomethyl-2-thiouridine)(34)-methyltransferase MnmD [Flavo
MKRQFLTTGDGSVTIYLPEWNEHYHSKHGAIQEALHVFIAQGLRHYQKTNNPSVIALLEIGFGTGLNALLSQQFAEGNNLQLNYTGVEAYPIAPEEVFQLNYAKLLNVPQPMLHSLHTTPWEVPCQISSNFTLTKQQKNFLEIDGVALYDLVYFDAFGARVQPELWTEKVFAKMFKALKPKGMLVTYAAKGSVRRAMQAVGFEVSRLPGPPGKREMLRSVKP